MTSLIQIKRSATQSKPDKLRIGELAYSYLDSGAADDSNRGLKLWIGAGVPAGGLDSNFIADSVQSIGGKFYTEKLDVNKFGITEGNKFVLLDSNRNINFINIDSSTVNELQANQLVTMNNLVVPVGTTAQRPSPFALGQIRFNTDTTTFEGYDGNAWGSLGGIKDIDQDTFIQAETSPNADNDDLRFFTAGTKRLDIDEQGKIVVPPSYTPDSAFSITTKKYVDERVLFTPTDSSLTDGAFTGFTANDTLTDVIDGLNEAINNVRTNTFVRGLTFVANPLQGGAGFTTTLTFTNDGNPNRYDINWGDGFIDSNVTSNSPTHVYNNPLVSPASVTVRAYNTGATGTGSEAFRTNADYITIFTSDPVANFELYRNASGGSALTGNDVYVIEGQPLYLRNTTTNTQVSNKLGAAAVEYSVNWGDGTSLDNVARDSDAGGVIGSRLIHTWANGTHTHKSRDNVLLSLDSHTTADPAVIPSTKSILLKVYDDNPATPQGLSTKTIAFDGPASGINPRLPAGFTKRFTGAASTAVGDPIARTITTTGDISTTAFSTFAHDAGAGTVSAQVNGNADGSVVMDGSSKVGRYTSLDVTAHSDFNLLDSSGANTTFALSHIHPNKFFGFKARVLKAATAVNPGLNNFGLDHSATGTTNIIEYVKDDVTAAPTSASGTLTQNVAGGFRFISGIPYYNSGSPSLTLSGITIANLTGKAFRDTNSPFQVHSGTNFETTTQASISTQNYTYAQIDGSTTFLTGGFPQEDVGVASPYAIGNVTIPITSSSVRTVEELRVRAINCNGNGAFHNLTATKVQVHTAAQSGVHEISTSVSNSLGATHADNAIRIFDFNAATTNTPAYTGSTNFYTNNVYTEASDPGVAGTQEASIRIGILKHDVTNYSTGFLPVGPNRSGDTGTQFATFAFRRTAVASFTLNLISPTGILGAFIALPGAGTDNSSTLNGWLDCATQYNGSGRPGADLGNGGNGSNGVASTGGDRILSNTSLNGSFTMNLGTENMTNSTGNVCLVRFALTSGQSITSFSIT